MVGRRRRSNLHPVGDDPLAVLGLPAHAGVDQIAAARRRLAKAAHPDVGGSADEMQRINAAVEAALADVAARSGGGPRAAGSGRGPRSGDGASDGSMRGDRSAHGHYDHPSFTVEALPVETFEALLVAAAVLGDVIDDDPPYRLEVALTAPTRGWCRLEVVPDAGASTISLAVGAEPGFPVPHLESVRDRWIDALNDLDWTDLG